ncbi:MAG: TonB-dependent receptor [Bacteroidetes bacterium]|jgi:TonB-linked SusC/RagA family outer membrane protein|nr:TonB-dependent receptor [Bacteroidota bacterium]MDF1863972.1 TonB-dependent receptor [Saprospiraceae bacterium]
MIKKLLFTLTFFITASVSMKSQEMAFAGVMTKTFRQQNQMQALTSALSELSDKYDVYFSYDVEILKDLTIYKKKLNGNNFLQDLKTVLRGTAMKFKKVGDQNYVIFKSSKKSKSKQIGKSEAIKRSSKKDTKIEKLSQKSTLIGPTTLDNIDLQTIQKEEFTVRGMVKDESDEPMIGVTIVLKSDPAVGTLTEFDGSFLLNIPDGQQTLVFSYIGYQTQEVEVSDRSEINVQMGTDFQTLDEVIVVGFGTQKKRFTTGAITKIDGEDLQNSTQTTVEGALQGRVAGVQVTTSDAMAGSPVTIRIRGTSSIVASSEPLYVVDGVPVVSGNYSKNNASTWRLATAHESNALSQLNPADIESIEILKDASAAAIYGSRGANGVVLITTKGGQKGKTKFNVGFQSGFSKETNRIEMLSGPQWLELGKEAWTNSYNDALADSDPSNDATFDIANDYEKFWQAVLPEGLTREVAERTDTDWIEEAIQDGHFQEMNLSASGGNDKTLFYLGGTYRDEQGIFVGNNFKRYNARVNLDHKPTEFLSLGARTAFTVTDSDIIPISWAGGLGTAQSQALPYWPIYNEDGTFFHSQSGNNVAAELANTEMNQTGTSILGNVYAQLTFLENFTLRSDFGVNNIYKKEFYYRSAIIEPEAISTSVLSESRNWNTNNTLSYSNTFGRHAIDVLAGMNATKNDFYQNVIDGETFPNPALKNPENAAVQRASVGTTQFSFLSFLGRLNYRFDDKYLLGVSVRRDGSSRFGTGNRWGTFPAVSLGWIVSDEGFLQDSETLTFLKLRASFGITGNAEIGNFEYFGSFATNNYVDMPGIVVEEIDNNGLSWESSKQYDIGMDIGLWNGRIEAGLDFYLKQTDDLLTEVDVSALSGVNRVTSNIGSLENKGFDFSITTHNTKGKFKWVTNLNLAYNSNEITNLGGLDFIAGQTFGLGAVGVGYPVGARYTVPWAGIAESDMNLLVSDPDDPSIQTEIQVKGGDELFINQFGELTNIYNPNDQVFFGNPTPVWTGGLSNSFNYKNFDLSVLITFATGHDLSNDEQRFQRSPFGFGWTMWSDGMNRWQNQGDQTDMHRLTWNSPNRTYTSGRVITDADYARLKDVTIGYNFPKALLQKWKLSNMRVYAKGTNLATLTGYEGWDPEYNRDGAGNVGQSKSWLPSPQARSISFGVNVTF